MANPWAAKISQVVKLDEQDRSVLENLTARAVSVEPGRTLARQGDRPDQMHVVLQGFLARYKILGDGQRQIVSLLVAGEACGLQAYTLDALDYGVCSIGEALVATLPRQEVLGVMARRPTLAAGLRWGELQAESILWEWITSLGRRNAYRRAAHLLHELHLRLSAAGLDGEDGYDFPLTQMDLSDVLGMSVVHVNRVLQRLREEGLIVLRQGRLTLPDPPRLAAAAGFDAAYLHLDCRGGARPVASGMACQT